jgi:hypothetical protein
MKDEANCQNFHKEESNREIRTDASDRNAMKEKMIT